MKNNIKKTGEFQCEGCGKVFASKNEWIEHRNHCNNSKEENSDYQEETGAGDDLREEEADEEALKETEEDEENPDEEGEYSKNRDESGKQKRMR